MKNIPNKHRLFMALLSFSLISCGEGGQDASNTPNSQSTASISTTKSLTETQENSAAETENLDEFAEDHPDEPDSIATLKEVVEAERLQMQADSANNTSETAIDEEPFEREIDYGMVEDEVSTPTVENSSAQASLDVETEDSDSVVSNKLATERPFKIYMQNFASKVPYAGQLTTVYSLQSHSSYNAFSDKEKRILDSLRKRNSLLMIDYEPPNNKEAVVKSASWLAAHLHALISSIEKAENLSAGHLRELKGMKSRLDYAKKELEKHRNNRFRIIGAGVSPLLRVYRDLNTESRIYHYTSRLKATSADAYNNYVSAKKKVKRILTNYLQPYGYIPKGTPKSEFSMVNIQDPFPVVLSSLMKYYRSAPATAKIGFYGILPWNTYCNMNGHNRTGQGNSYNSSFGGKVDYIAIPVYFSTYCGGSFGRFKAAVDSNLALAKKYQPNKDAYIVLGATFSDSYVNMKRQLDTIYKNKNANGVLIWTSSGTVNTYNGKRSCKVKNAKYKECWIDAVAEFSCSINSSKSTYKTKCAKYQ